ncbi:MAG: DUF1080 domain-containing protein [Planctomycetes bacterium]|nr:DUF1080 domain-containing protein [Planctomycetota bacterium]
MRRAPSRVGAALFALSLACAGPPPPAPAWTPLFDGASLAGWESIAYGGEGELELVDGCALLGMGATLTGMRYPVGLPRTLDYELELTAARRWGNDFFCGLTFPIGDEHATLILGGWGGGLCGLSCVDGADASDNATKSYRGFEAGRDYAVRVRVEAARVRAWVDGELVVDVPTAGHRFSLRTEVLPSPPLAVSSYVTAARVGPLRWRPLR